jgi:ribosomal protein S18 acetylase RimI-like enzyme
MDINYKPADNTDIESIFSLNKLLIDEYENIEIIDYQKVLSWVRNKIETHIQEYTCVTFNGKKVGYYFFHHTDGKMEIDDLYVFSQYQNMGIGTKILKKCISETNLPVFLYVFANNKRAVALYQKLGFQVTEIINGSRYIMQRN